MARHENSRTPKPAARARASRRGGAGGTLIGIFIGLVLGLGLAAGVAYYLMRSPASFAPAAASRDVREPGRDPAKVAKSEPGSEKPRFEFYDILRGAPESLAQAEKKTPDRAVAEQSRERAADKSAGKTVDKAVDKTVDKAVEKSASPERALDKATPSPEKLAKAETSPPAKNAERFWLQAGSFATEADAENLKARLAFSGWQANVVTGTMPDKAVRYRVRLGPFDNTDELNRMRGDLAKNGFDVAVIRN